MKLKVYNLTGKETGKMEISNAIFKVAIKPEVVHAVFVQQMNNQREPWADTKTRGKVRGGGRKPWAQKGTGRARHGSIRSPIWRGGGVTFGPLSTRNYKTKINKKTRRLALKMCLTDKALSKDLLIVEDFNFAESKTKLFAAFLKQMPTESKTFLILTAGKDANVIRMSKNLQKVEIMRAEDVNVMELLRKGAVIASKDAIKKIEGILKK